MWTAFALIAYNLGAKKIMAIDGSSTRYDVIAWLDAAIEMAWLGPPRGLVEFVRATVSTEFPPHFDRHLARETALCVLKGLLVNAEGDGHRLGDYRAAVESLIGAGVLKRDDMSAAEAVEFLGEHRENRGAAPGPPSRSCSRSGAGSDTGFGRYNPVVRAMVELGARAGKLGSDNMVASDEIAAACGDAAEDGLHRAAAFRALFVSASMGMRLDMDVLLAPGQDGRELLTQARRMQEHFTGVPVSMWQQQL